MADELSEQASGYGKQALDAGKQAGKQAVDAGRQALDQGRQYGQHALEAGREYGNQAVEYGRNAGHAVQDATAKISTEVYLMGALGSIGISLTLKLLGRDRDAEFVGHWAPTFLTLGLLTKLFEHDRKVNTPVATPRGNRSRTR